MLVVVLFIFIFSSLSLRFLAQAWEKWKPARVGLERAGEFEKKPFKIRGKGPELTTRKSLKLAFFKETRRKAMPERLGEAARQKGTSPGQKRWRCRSSGGERAAAGGMRGLPGRGRSEPLPRERTETWLHVLYKSFQLPPSPAPLPQEKLRNFPDPSSRSGGGPPRVSLDGAGRRENAPLFIFIIFSLGLISPIILFYFICQRCFGGLQRNKLRKGEKRGAAPEGGSGCPWGRALPGCVGARRGSAQPSPLAIVCLLLFFF